jgi:hypothetical protein
VDRSPCHGPLEAAIVIVVLFAPSVVCWLKGKRAWAFWGFVTWLHWIPVFRLAKPESWWARRFYGDRKLARAFARFPTKQADSVEA